jgi:curved DNA-binding protein CbpA
MSRLNLAYSVLSDVDQRQLYDLILDEQIASDATAAYQDSRERAGAAAAQAGYSMGTLKRSASAQSMDGQLASPCRNRFPRRQVRIGPPIRYSLYSVIDILLLFRPRPRMD